MQKNMVPSRIELLILALLAPRLNQLGQGTNLQAKDVKCLNTPLKFKHMIHS